MPHALLKHLLARVRAGNLYEERFLLELGDRDVPKLATPNAVGYCVKSTWRRSFSMELGNDKVFPAVLVILYH